MKTINRVMDYIKKVAEVLAIVFLVSLFSVFSSCRKEGEIHLKDFDGKVVGTWQLKSIGVPFAQRAVTWWAAPDELNAYGVLYDATNFAGNLIHQVTITHDGGKTWNTQAIPGLENNWLDGVASVTPNVVHVLGWDGVNGGGNVFRSKDGGKTWQREAANAFTDASSFPDIVQFFNPQDGILFGDPVNGQFQVYTTHNGGDSWDRVPSSQVPAALPTEFGLAFHTDVYKNTVWLMTEVFDNSFTNLLSSRLLQSDDKGETWYVKNPSLVFTSGDGVIKFRNPEVGLYKNNGKLFRTTNGGNTWNQLNYSGSWFSYDLDNVPGRPGWWVSTGGDENTAALSVRGRGSSISYDDGEHWITIDTAVDHTALVITSPTHGYSGGVTTGKGGDGVFVYSRK